MTVTIVIAAVVVIAAVIAAVAVRRARRPDGVAAFQRQIDALSPRARRPVVDQVQQLDESDRDSGDPPRGS